MGIDKLDDHLEEDFKNDYEKLSLYHDLDKIDNKNDTKVSAFSCP